MPTIQQIDRGKQRVIWEYIYHENNMYSLIIHTEYYNKTNTIVYTHIHSVMNTSVSGNAPY